MIEDQQPEGFDVGFSEAEKLKSLVPGLDAMDGPVEIQTGRETYELTVDAINTFQVELLPDLQLGEKTRHTYDQILNKLVQEGGVSVYDTTQARFIRYEEWRGGRIVGQDGEPEVEMGPSMINKTREWIAEAEVKTGIALEPELREKVVYGWLVWHELGHGLQAAYSDAADPQPATEWISRAFKADLSDDMLAWGVSQPEKSNSGLSAAHTVESEKFAEGFGQMMVEQYLTKHGLSLQQAHDLREALVPENRKQRSENARQILDKYKDVSPSNDTLIMDFYRDLRAAGITVNMIGYAEPYPPDQIQNILSQAAEFENLPWQERLKRSEGS